jgi:Ca-activated chloride channel homolog
MSAQCASLRHRWIFCALLLGICADANRTDAQTKAPRPPSYSLTVSVDEVSLTFHAADAHGLPINDLKLDELSVLDNGRSPRRIVAFHSLRDFPIRAGILMDTSRSMQEYISRNRAISIEYTQRLLRQRTDQAFVMDFDSQSGVVQSWTSDAVALAAGIRRFPADGQSRISGTAIFDSIYRACFNQFRTLDSTDSGNFILLFSDGEDASRSSLDEAVAMCQRTNTAIYIFRVVPETGFSTGSRTLAELASKSGGRVFYDDDSDATIYSDLQIIEANLRNQYRLVYTPVELKRDGSFHRIELETPQRVGAIRAGYYAPRH